MSLADAPVASATTTDTARPAVGLEDKIDRLTAQVEELLVESRRQADLIDMVGELVHDAAPLATDALARLVDHMAAFERAGYLDAIQRIAQPELLTLLQEMVEAVRLEQTAVESEPAEPPTLWELARRTRDPEVRRGMARALDTLRAVSVTTGGTSAGTNEPT